MHQSNRRQSAEFENLEVRRLLSAAIPEAILTPIEALRSPSEIYGRSGGATRGDDHDGLTLVYTPATRMLENIGGYLTAPQAGDPLSIARSYMTSRADSLGLSPSSVASAIVTNQYANSDSGITHIYLRQTHNGLPVVGAEMGVHVMPDGRILTASSSFLPGLAESDASVTPSISSVFALNRAAEALGLSTLELPRIIEVNGASTLNALTVSLDPIPTDVTYVATADGPRLAWDMVIRPPGPEGDWYNIAVDAHGGDIVFSDNWTDHLAQYNVIPLPLEAPNDGSRAIVVDPAHATASPFGWHDTNGVAGAESTLTLGNNVTAYTDTDANNSADAGSQPDGTAALSFDFPLDLGQAPSAYRPASVTNLFYWNNVNHDVHYLYGFTEAAGNFQINNYGLGGLGNDRVRAESQDGGGLNNANFSTPPDGSLPRMQMYVWTAAAPDRDSSFDTGVITHEYGHGVSNRLTGGPANSSALSSLQSGAMGEGWGDWWGLMFVQKPTDTMNGGYGIGTYLNNQPNTGNGIRRFPYSFDMSVNPLTYQHYNGAGNWEVHRGGEIWASALWDLNWLLIQKHGFDSNLYTGYTGAGAGAAGNKLALKLVMDALKLQPANPSMLQARDAILSADTALTGGANHKEIWIAFARRGMGLSAFDGGGAAFNAVAAAFDTPASLGLDTRVIASTPNTWTTLLSGPSSISFTFHEAMNTGSFSIASDVVSFTSPTAADLKPTISGFSWSGDAKTLTLDFTTPTTLGAYSMVIGPNILAADDSDPMDQDMDETSGEATDDRYTAGFTINPVVGPNTFGYQARQWTFENVNLVPGGAGVTTIISNSDDAQAGIPLGSNTFNFYGTTYTGAGQLFASSNALMTFGTGNSSALNTNLNSSPAQASIAVLWNDWVTDQTTADQVMYKFEDLNADSISDRLIVEWNDVPGFLAGTNGLTFQAILQLNTGSLPGSIVLNYVDMDAGHFAFNNGGSAAVGIKNTSPPGHDRLLVARDLVNNPFYNGNSKAVRIATDWISPTVTSEVYAFNNDPPEFQMEFSENVGTSLSLADITVTNVTTAQVIPSGNMTLIYTGGPNNSARILFNGYPDGAPPDGNYTISFNSAGVTDPSLNPLGGTTSFNFFVLAGDANRDKTVDTTDFNILAANFSLSPRTFGEGDFNYDGTVDTTDFNILAANFSDTLP